ncbi:TetR/AcrR family transcriptional regulator [Devosia sp. BK]|uniref:TetR/AcrR family transcriptional regulator n=1 Tax=Devosia sp. BK TaxID=2871706 RepID=UPI0029399C00|nr:TetR/AcrR family transcriptional regulator [Devosia sp. BK]MDV3252545.1 TetR/AcrR family transcriptional regulator [Devosia sp. BK]
MQERRTQEARRQATRKALLDAARRHFAERGYAGTNTPEVVAEAGVTRGALYHHFADKKALFVAVVEAEHASLAEAINAATDGDEPGPVKALIEGGDAYLTAMEDEGRRRILLIDAPAVLERDVLEAINARYGLKTLVDGVDAAVRAGAIRDLPVEALAQLLDALFDRAALAPPDQLSNYRKAIKALIRGLKT